MGTAINRFNEPVQIKELWKDIIAAIDDGSYIEKYYIGDYVLLNIGMEDLIRMQLAAVDIDEGKDGTARTTWVALDLLNVQRSMSQVVVDDSTSWGNSTLRRILNTEIFELLPEVVQDNIKTVLKNNNVHFQDGTVMTLRSDEKLWIPSEEEVFYLGKRYPVFKNPEGRTRYINGKSADWWTRTARDTDKFATVHGGYCFLNHMSSVNGVALSFCI